MSIDTQESDITLKGCDTLYNKNGGDERIGFIIKEDKETNE